MAREDFAVRGMMPEMNPNEVSPLAVQGPMAAQPDLSQFGGLGPLDGYEANPSGAQQGAPTSYAFPENYGNPKNKIYQLSAGADDGVRLKAVDGTILFEGKGPDAAAKAAAIVQELGKKFNTQSTWILDKQTAGGDWKQVSQDTVGDKKTTAVNSFLNVALPMVGTILGGVPGAILGSVGNSALQNKNSAVALKDAAIAGASAYIGGKIFPVSGAPIIGSVAPEATSAALSTAATVPVGTAIGNAVQSSLAAATEQAAAKAALAKGVETLVVHGVKQAVPSALTSTFAPSLVTGLSGLIPKKFNPADYNVEDFKVDPKPAGDGIEEIVVPGVRPVAPPTPPPVNPLSVLPGAVAPSLAAKPYVDDTLPENQFEIKAQKLQEPQDLRVAGPVSQATLLDALNNGLPDLTVTASPTTPVKTEPLQAPDARLDPLTAGLNGLLGEPIPKTPMEKTQDWIKKNPLEAASLGLTLIGGLGGAGSGGGSGGGYGGNTLSYPGGGQPGTSGSLGGIFTSKLPTATGSAALAVTPRDMGQRDWLRYGFGPEASFFSNVPDRQALAVQKPTIAAMPALSEKLSEPAPNLMVKPDTQTASVPADGTMLNGNPSIVWNGGVNGGWMQTERGMPPPEEIATQAAFARGGSTGGTSHKPRSEFAVHGAGTGRSDDIPAVLSDGEYVMDAETVALLGDGSSKAGAKKLDELRVNLRRHKGVNLAKGRFSVNAKSPEKYLTGGRV